MKTIVGIVDRWGKRRNFFDGSTVGMIGGTGMVEIIVECEKTIGIVGSASVGAVAIMNAGGVVGIWNIWWGRNDWNNRWFCGWQNCRHS